MMFSDCDYSYAVQNSKHTGFLANVRAEITHQVRRTSHHPSVALWLSNNEITADTGKKDCLEKGGRSCWQVLFLDTIMDAIVAVDRSRPLWPYSHSDGWAAGVDPETGLRSRDGAPLVMRDGQVG
jgi:beta-galactosidase/beta-glucuronidase